MWGILFITLLIITAIEGIYLWINWKKLKAIIDTMKAVNSMMKNFKGIGFETPMNTKSFKMKVAMFISNHMGHPWVLVSIVMKQ